MIKAGTATSTYVYYTISRNAKGKNIRNLRSDFNKLAEILNKLRKTDSTGTDRDGVIKNFKKSPETKTPL